MDETEILIKEQLNRLPQDVQKALISFDWKKEVKDISNQILLNLDQSRDLETEVLLLIYSFEPEGNFYNNLLYKVGLTADVAEKVFDLIEEKVLKPLALVVEGVGGNPSVVSGPIDTQSSENLETPLTEISTPDNKTLEERKKVVSIPDYSNYDAGKDPYREPIE